MVVAIGNGSIRHNLVHKYRVNSNLKFPSLIDPNVDYSEDLIIGKGNIICAGSIITVDVKIGDFTIINLDCTVGHGVRIDDYVTLNPSVNVSGDCRIGRLSNIGTGTQIIQGKTVGESVILGAGAVVCNDIQDYCTAVGVPAKVIKNNEEDKSSEI